jgi:hypothetical protein
MLTIIIHLLNFKTMKNYFVRLVLFMLLSSTLAAQDSFDVQLFPNQAYTCSVYIFVRRDTPGPLVQATYRLTDTSPERWLRDFNPKVVKSTWTLDPTRVDHYIKAPSTTSGSFGVGIFRDNASIDGPFRNYTVGVRPTNGPKAADTILINAQPNDVVTINRVVHHVLDIPNFDGLGNTYKIPTPDGLQRFKLVVRDSNLTWLKVSSDSFALSRIDSVKTVQLRFTSPTIGNYETYMATYRQYRGFPAYTLIRFNVKNTTATQDLPEESVNIFPNPVNNQFLIESENLIEQYHIFDLTGKCLFTTSVNSYNAQVNTALPKGVYLLKLQTNKGNLTKKIVVKP